MNGSPNIKPPVDDTAQTPWRARLHEVIFEADTPAGKRFDVALFLAIVLSIAAVLLESVKDIHAEYGKALLWAEWSFTILFTVEYVLRLLSVRRPWRYALSFYGIVDLLAIVPTYLGLVLSDQMTSLLVIRVLRLLRIFRVFKMVHLLHESNILLAALRASRRKITVFLGAVLSVVVIVGALLYIVERNVEGTQFTSIPRGMYWAIVTMTTVGYGDVVPSTGLGQALASFLMILGYGMIAVPTGIVSVEIGKAEERVTTQACPECGAGGHDHDAAFCKHCGASLQGTMTAQQ